MPIHYFHCTDGRDAVFDRRGRSVMSLDEVEAPARAVAVALMRSVPNHPDWSGWFVGVHDADGRWVADVPFPAPSEARRSPAKPSRGHLVAA